MVGEYIDILVIAETKIDLSFSTNQFLIGGCKSPYRPNVSGNSGGVLVYVRDNLLSKQLNTLSIQPDIQVVLFEINFRKQKWLMLAIYKPPKQNSRYFVEQISKLLDKHSRYEKVMVLGGFNLEPNDIALAYSIEDHSLYDMVKHRNCFKSSKGRCIDLIFYKSEALFHAVQVI